MRNDKDLYTQNCNLRAKTIQEKTFNKIIVKNEIKPVQRSYTTKNTNKNKTKKKKYIKKKVECIPKMQMTLFEHNIFI